MTSTNRRTDRRGSNAPGASVERGPLTRKGEGIPVREPQKGLGLRIPLSLHERLSEYAAVMGRSQNQLLVLALEEFLEREEPKMRTALHLNLVSPRRR